MDPDGAGRRISRPLDRMEDQGDEYRRQLRAGFLREAATCNLTHVIDAGRPIEAIQADIWRIAAKSMGINS
jgi:thymidylate kinase